MLDLAGCALWNTILGTLHIKKDFFFFKLQIFPVHLAAGEQARGGVPSRPPPPFPSFPPPPPPGARLAGAAPSRAPTWFLPAAVWMGRPPDSAEGAAGRGRARAPAAAAPAPAPRRPTPGSASLSRAWAGAGAANVARAESPNVTARRGWRRRRRAGEGEGAARAGRRRERRRREDAAGEVPLPPPARRSPEEPPPPTRPSGAPSGLAGRKERRVRAGGGEQGERAHHLPFPPRWERGRPGRGSRLRRESWGPSLRSWGWAVLAGECAKTAAAAGPVRTCSLSAKWETRWRSCGGGRTWGTRVAGPRGHSGAGVLGSGPRAAATGRRGRHLARVGDSQRNSVRRGSERRANEAAGLGCASSLRESRGCESIPLTRLGSSRGARGCVVFCAWWVFAPAAEFCSRLPQGQNLFVGLFTL